MDTRAVPKDFTSFHLFYLCFPFQDGPDGVTVSVGSKLNVTEGGQYGSTDISCKASSACNPPCNNVTWTRENEITVITRKERLFAEDITIKRTQAGKYTCFVSNGKSPNKTGSVEIEVHCKFLFLKIFLFCQF